MPEPPDAIDVRWTPHGFDATVTRITGMPKKAQILSGLTLPIMLAAAFIMDFDWMVMGIFFTPIVLVSAYLFRFHRPEPLHVSVLNGRLRIGENEPIELEPGMRLGEFDEDYVTGMHLWTRDGDLRAFIELIAMDLDSKTWLREALDATLK